MRFPVPVLFILMTLSGIAQNNASLSSADGSVFKAIVRGGAINAVAQSHVIIENRKEDTLSLQLEFEDKQKYPAVLYLLEKGRPVKGKEFSYSIERSNGKIKVHYLGMYDIIPLPDPIVPKKPQPDTSLKYRNKVLGHFCELKEGKPVYFNNLPKKGDCTIAMPAEYLNYVAILMSKAEVPDHKYRIAENTGKNNCISVEQLNQLLTHVEYELDKLKLVRAVYFNLVDPEKQKDLEKSFGLESTVRELNHFFRNSPEYRIKAANNCIQASPKKDVEDYAQKFDAYTNDAQRLEFLKKTSPDLCYSVDQVALLLQKFIHDREKLEAAKLLYFSCVEKENYLSVSAVFSYDETTDELKDFIDKQTK